MRILHVSPSYAPCIGGAETLLQNVSERLVARGHHVTVFTVNAATQSDFVSRVGASLPEEEVINGVLVRRFSPHGGSWEQLIVAWQGLKGGYRSTNLLFSAEGLEMLTRRHPRPLAMIPSILRSDADIVASINWHFPSAYYVHLARRLKRFRLVGVPLFHTNALWAQSSLYRRMLAPCDAVIVGTNHEKEFVDGLAKKRVEVAGLGVEPARFVNRKGATIRERYDLMQSPIVGFVGRQDESKGVVVLLEAMSRVWQWNPDTVLILAGPRAHRSQKVAGAIEALSPPNRRRVVLIDDFADQEGPSIFDACDVFVLPSVEESFGIVYLEAWMCQKPVVGARAGSTPCVIDDGVDGLMARPQDAEELAGQIMDLLSDRDKRDRMGRMGYAKTLALYTWDIVTDKWEKLYLDLIQRGLPRCFPRPR